jgi:uncharacterized membrane protein YjgN (DUF898 family)
MGKIMDTLNVNGGEKIGHAAQTTSTAAAKPPIIRLNYHGKNGEIFRLHIMNLLMSIITLGIYSFWGKTRIRRYMTSHITIQKDRFEYTGTGGELLIGWLKALVIFLPLIICMYIPIINFIAIPVFLGIVSIAIYLAMRYRLSRTRWRGIRFNLGGSIKEYFFISLKRTIKNIVSLGWRIPKSDIIRWSYIANHMSYGSLKFSYEGDYTRLQKIHAITLSIFIIAFLGGVVPIVGASLSMGAEVFEATKINQEMYNQNPVYDKYGNPVAYKPDPNMIAEKGLALKEALFVNILLMYVGLGIAFIGRLWYNAALWQEQLRGLKLANLRFKSDVTGKNLVILFITNLLIIIFTLGLGKPIVAQRTLRYYVTHLRIGGDLAQLIAHQEKAKEKSGMGDALAADVGFDLGL